MSLQISTVLHRRLLALAGDDPAREVCGLLLGGADVVEVIVEAANVAADPARAFEIDPRVQIDAVKAARGGGPRVIGCYHSHPSGVARPSQRDLEVAEMGSTWLIIAGGEILGWRRTVGGFDATKIHLVG